MAAALSGGAGAPKASAGTECEGLPECIRVVGPWVDVQPGPAPTYFRVRCPGQGQTIGGLDADRPRGRDGSSSASSARLAARSGRASPRAVRSSSSRSRRCRGRSPSGRSSAASRRPAAAVARGPRTSRRARSRRWPGQRPSARGSRAASRRCGSSTTTASRSPTAAGRPSGCSPSRPRSPSAVALRPSTARLASVSASARRVGDRVVATVRGRPPAGVRVELQIHAVCVR